MTKLLVKRHITKDDLQVGKSYYVPIDSGHVLAEYVKHNGRSYEFAINGEIVRYTDKYFINIFIPL